MSSAISSLPEQVLGSLDLAPLSSHQRLSAKRKMVDYKLRYLPFRARAEPIRFMFHFAGIGFEDERIPLEEWPEVKANLPFHQVPVLEFEGNQFFGSETICRFLGRQFGLCGSSEVEMARCDEVANCMQELIPILNEFWFTADEERKEALKQDLLQNKFPDVFLKFEGCIERAGGKYLVVGDGVTWADLFVVAWLENCMLLDPELLEAYPKLKELYEDVRGMDPIKDYIESRPETVY